jgi:hypothetical protein
MRQLHEIFVFSFYSICAQLLLGGGTEVGTVRRRPQIVDVRCHEFALNFP